MLCRRFISVHGLIKRSLWTGSEPLNTSDPDVYNLLKQEKKRQVCTISNNTSSYDFTVNLALLPLDLPSFNLPPPRFSVPRSTVPFNLQGTGRLYTFHTSFKVPRFVIFP